MELNEIQKNFINEKLNNLSYSKFRSSFKLRKKELDYLNSKGLDIIESHCHDFINTRLSPYPTPNDGKQTPMRGHPVFVAQHATATCCRGCLNKWYKIPKDRELTTKEKKFIEALIMEWIKRNSR
jgi:exodeoxyribonuclease V alpha subunit